MNITNKVGAFEAKTNLSSLLQRVEQGKEFVITKHNKPIALLTPFASQKKEHTRHLAINRLVAIRNSIKSKVVIRDFINEGRKR
ncbi:MAG: hypothetical protein LDLANPLL_01519 [Turneriella sp.]|nr:hypothetical protein [Turneriella sp.]